MARAKRVAEAVRSAVEAHPWALGALAAAAVVAMAALVGWYLVFSGMNEPVQFVYSSF